MSGHSKFANIKHKKEKNDAAKGKIFTVIGREIAVAVKEGGADPANNSKLRDVIAKAKANNMNSSGSTSYSSLDTIICPFFWNMKDTHPLVPMLPFPLEKAALTLAAVRFLLSVRVSTIMAIPLGP